MKKRKHFEMPHVLIVLLVIMVTVAALTYTVPSGEFVRVFDEVTGRDVVQPDQFHFIEKEAPVGFLEFFPGNI